MKKVLQEIEAERLRQDEKWGEQNYYPEQWNIVLDEELSEFKKELCEAIFEKHEPIKKERLQKMRAELIQTAAVAVAWVESLDRNELKGESLIVDKLEFLEQHEFLGQIKTKGNKILIVCFNTHQVFKELSNMGILNNYSYDAYGLGTVYGSFIKIWNYNTDDDGGFGELEFDYVLYLIDAINKEVKTFIDSRIKLNKKETMDKPKSI